MSEREREWCLTHVTEKPRSHGRRRGGREQDAHRAEKGQCGGSPVQGRGSRVGREGGGEGGCLVPGTQPIWKDPQRGYGSTGVNGAFFLTLLTNSKALIKMFNFIESELGTCISSHENALFPSGVCLVTLA